MIKLNHIKDFCVTRSPDYNLLNEKVRDFFLSIPSFFFYSLPFNFGMFKVSRESNRKDSV